MIARAVVSKAARQIIMKRGVVNLPLALARLIVRPNPDEEPSLSNRHPLARHPRVTKQKRPKNVDHRKKGADKKLAPKGNHRVASPAAKEATKSPEVLKSLPVEPQADHPANQNLVVGFPEGLRGGHRRVEGCAREAVEVDTVPVVGVAVAKVVVLATDSG